MCLIKDGEALSSPIQEKISADPALEVEPPRSPWAKLLFRQVSKPKLSRKITSSAKVNLNKYWTKFGELMASPTSSKSTLCDRLAKMSIQRKYQHSEAKKKLFFEDDDAEEPKALNQPLEDREDNARIIIGRSRSAVQRFELLDDGVNEIDENLANEIREITYLKISDIFSS